MGSISLLVLPRNISCSPILPSLHQVQQCRTISSTATLLGKKNFRKFFLGNKRGTKIFRRNQMLGKHDDKYPLYKWVQDNGYYYDRVFHPVPEMKPDIIVPDLTDCQLKPYVSYRTANIYQSEFTAQDLFDVVYRDKIKKDFVEDKLDELGNPVEPNVWEKLTPDEALALARRTGSDIFSERTPKFWECLEKDLTIEKRPQISITSDDLTHPSETKRLTSTTSTTSTQKSLGSE